ncbi:hypothetical protein N657DRAFT_412846 [Parathielavia appendiculata]|uniref:Uncharacterized protein n=1 Tax=Parathielavia appendiculata TaxID=2587402 RepID=A0AAN6TZ98_9PEZI|nr:hypothetical protein N657DRAFT_412846 [Parathielavia appendiculata]
MPRNSPAKYANMARIAGGLQKLHTVFLSLAVLSLLPFAACSPQIRHRTPKALVISVSALSSLSRGMTSLQLELLDDGAGDPNIDNPADSKLTKMCLRIACAVSSSSGVVVSSAGSLSIRGWGLRLDSGWMS